MSKLEILMLITLCGLLSACEEDTKSSQMIIPQAQLDALDKAKNMENELLKIQQQKEQQLQRQGL